MPFQNVSPSIRNQLEYDDNAALEAIASATDNIWCKAEKQIVNVLRRRNDGGTIWAKFRMSRIKICSLYSRKRSMWIAIFKTVNILGVKIC